MSNSSTGDVIHMTIIYYPLFLVIVGTILNLLTFIILCRPPFRDTSRQSVMHYMRAIAIFDILMLYGWNLDHYLSSAYGFTLLSYSIASCKFFTFLNYIAAQSSAWLRVFICMDRYCTLGQLNRRGISNPKYALIIITCIIAVFSLLNLPLPIVACYYRDNGTISANGKKLLIYPLWDYINLGVYNCLPFLLMVIFNSGVIYHLIHLRHTATLQNSRIQHRSSSITLVILTFLFSIMTIPATVGYAFFGNTAPTSILYMLDSILYTYHILSFPLYFITFGVFRRECIAMIVRPKKNRRVVPMPAAMFNGTPSSRIFTVKNAIQAAKKVNLNLNA